MATPKPLSSPQGLRASRTPQAYDRRAAEERRQLVRQYREQERRNQERRESEAAERVETAEREYQSYRNEAENLRRAESQTSSAAAAFNAVRDRFNAAKSAEEQKRIEPELLRRADEYNQASKNLERQAFRYNASVNAAKKSGVISEDAKGVEYKADRLNVTFETVSPQEDVAADSSLPILSLPESQDTIRGENMQLPMLSRPESSGPVVGANLAAGPLYVPQSEAEKVVAGTQTVTAPGTVPNTAGLVITEPFLSEKMPAGPVVGEGAAVSPEKPWAVEEAFAVKNALGALDTLRKETGKKALIIGTVASESGFDITGESLKAAGTLLLNPSTIQKENIEPTESLKQPAEKEQEPNFFESLRIEVGTRLVEGGEKLSEKTGGVFGPFQSALGEVIINPQTIQKENIEPTPEEYKEYNKNMANVLYKTGEVVSELTNTNLGNIYVAAGEDLEKNVPYVTEGIKITDKGIENLPSPGFMALAGLTTGALLGAAGAAGAFAGGFGNPVNLIRPAAPLVIEGAPATGGFAGGTAGSGAGLAVSAATAEPTVSAAALAGIGILSGKNEVGLPGELEVSKGDFLSGRNEFSLPSEIGVSSGGLGILSGKNEVGLPGELEVSKGDFLSGRNEFSLPSEIGVSSGGLGILSGKNEGGKSTTDVRELDVWSSKIDILSGKNEASDITQDSFAEQTATADKVKEQQADRTAGGVASAAGLSFRPSNRVNNSEIDILDYAYGNVTINPEKNREEYTKRTPFIEVNKNPYEYASQNRVQNQNRFDAYFAFDYPAETALRNKRRKLPDIDLPELTGKPRRKRKSKSRSTDAYYVSDWLPAASDLFAQPKKSAGRKRKNTADALLTQTRRRGGLI